MPSNDAELICPACETRYPSTERICPDCAVPLTYPGARESEPASEEHGRARKVRPQFTRGELVNVAFAQNQAESELIQGLLLEEGIPSIERRARGFDVPDFLAAGPRNVLVPASAGKAASELLARVELADDPGDDVVVGEGEDPDDLMYGGPGVVLRVTAAVVVISMAVAALAVTILVLLG